MAAVALVGWGSSGLSSLRASPVWAETRADPGLGRQAGGEMILSHMAHLYPAVYTLTPYTSHQVTRITPHTL